MIREGTRFTVELRAPRLGQADFHRCCHVFRMFAVFGSLGSRSRRTFGSLRLLTEAGDLPSETTSWGTFPNRRIDWLPLPEGPWKTLAEMRAAAGMWLKTHRNNRTVLPKHQRGEVFGHAGHDGPPGERRRASPVILKPMIDKNRRFVLGLILPRPASQLVIDATA
jgi:hypothetical protein